MPKDTPRKFLPLLVIHVSVLLLAPLPFLSLLAGPTIESAETQGLLRETSGAAIVSIGAVVEGTVAGEGVVMRGTVKDVLFFAFLALGLLGLTAGGGWVCFIRTRAGSNWRILGGILILASLLASLLLTMAGAGVLSRGSVCVSSQSEGIQLTAEAWGSPPIDRFISLADDPRIVLYRRLDRSSSDKVALVWSTETGVEALWLCSFSGEADSGAGKFAREVARSTGLPLQAQSKGEDLKHLLGTKSMSVSDE